LKKSRKTIRAPKKRAPLKIRQPGRPSEVLVHQVLNDFSMLFEELGISCSRQLPKYRGTALFKRAQSMENYADTLAISDLLTLWHQDPDYLDAKGMPLPIRMRAGNPCFRSLAERSVPDMPPARLIRELKRLRAIRIDDRRYIHVRVRSLITYRDKRHTIIHTLNSLRGFINTLLHNIEGQPSNTEPLFQRVAWNSSLEFKDIPRLKNWLKRHGQALLESADGWMMRKSVKANAPFTRRRRYANVSVGVYLSVN